MKMVQDITVHMTGLAPSTMSSFRLEAVPLAELAMLDGAYVVRMGDGEQIFHPAWCGIVVSEPYSLKDDAEERIFTSLETGSHLGDLIEKTMPGFDRAVQSIRDREASS